MISSCDLVGTAVDMGVVHGDLPHAKQPGQRARALVPVQPADLGDAQRQVPVRAQRVAVHVRRLRAVHRLQAERLLLDVELEHVVAVEVPVPGLLPQLLVHQDRRRGLEVAVRVVDLAPERLELAEDHHAVGQPEGGARRDVVEHEQVELAPELSVIALLGLLEAPEVLVEVRLGEPCGAVDPLQHRVPLVPAPVGPGGRQELEDLDGARRGHVRAAAQVHEIALVVQRHRGRVDPAQDLDLEGLAALLEEPDGGLARQLLPDERVIRRDDLPHRRLDPLEVFRGERRGLQEIVVEAVLDGGADGDPDLGEELLHRLRHDVRGRVTQGGQRLGDAVEFPGQLEMSIFFGLGHSSYSFVRQKSITRTLAR